jgi:predicted Fe-S protein YdhL (DUF1289 family)
MESPCVLVCVLDPATGLCQGCGRSREEIAGWSRFTPEVRRRIMARLAAEREGGRTGKPGSDSGANE